MYKIFNNASGTYLDRTFPDKKSAKEWIKNNNLSTHMYEIVKT